MAPRKTNLRPNSKAKPSGRDNRQKFRFDTGRHQQRKVTRSKQDEIRKLHGHRRKVGERVVWEYHNVSLTRVPGFGFGIAVSGGRDNPHFSNGDPSIAISDVLKAGPAEGKLLINDRIISANAVSLENVDYATAVQVLRECGSSVNLVVRRRVVLSMASSEPQTLKVTITRGKKKEDLGIVLGCHIYVREVNNSSLLDRETNVQEGDLVLKINNASTESMSLKDAKKLMDSSKEKLNLVLKREHGSASARPATTPDGQRWSVEFSPQSNFTEMGGTRGQWSNQNLYVQPPTRGDYRPPPPPPDRAEEKNNLSRLPTGRNRGPLMDISLSQLDQPATPLLASNSPRSQHPVSSIPEEEDPPPPRPPPPRVDPNARDLNMRGELYDDDPLSRRSKTALPDPRYICFQKDGSVGIRLTGGNEVGIFVTAVQPGSPASLQGLQPGDKILKVKDKDMRGVTREEAVLFLLSIQDQVNLIVQHRKEEYDEIVAEQKGDSFYVRTHFNYESSGKAELSFHVAEVFHVIDTLYNGVVGSWMVFRMGRNNQQIQKGVIPNRRRAEELSHEQQMQAKKEAASESRGSFFKRRSARRSKSLGKDHWEDVVFADGLSKFPAYECVTLKHPGFVRPVVLFGPLSDVARDKLLKDYPDKYASPQLDNRMEDIPKSQKASGIIRLSAIREIIEKGKHAVLDITPSAVDRLNYAQFYPIVIFMKAENKHTVKELRSRLAKSSHKSSKKLYDHATKLEKLWTHVFTASIALTSADMWYKKLRETIEKQQQLAIWVSETKPQEVISDDFLFPMTSRLSYASSPESDLDLTTDTRPLSLTDCLSSPPGAGDRRLVKASSDPSIATQEDTSYNSPPPPYSLARPRQELMGSVTSGLPNSRGRESLASPKHRNSQAVEESRNDDYYGAPVRSPLDHYSSLTAAEKHMSQANGDIQGSISTKQSDSAVPPPQVDRQRKPTHFRAGKDRAFGNSSWPEHREREPPQAQPQPQPSGINPDYINTSKSNSLDRNNRKLGTFDNSSYSSDSFNKYMGGTQGAPPPLMTTPEHRPRDSINSASLGGTPGNGTYSHGHSGVGPPSHGPSHSNSSQHRGHDPYRYTRSTAQWPKPLNNNNPAHHMSPERPAPPPNHQSPNKYRHPEEKPAPPSPPPKPNVYHSRMSDGRPVPPPKPVLYQQQQQQQQQRPPQWHPSDGRQDNFNNNKRISQDMAHSPPRGMPPPHENSVPPYGHGPPSRRSDGSEFSGMSPLYGSRNYMDPPPMRPPPSVPENPYQSRHPNRRPYHEENNFDSRNHDPRSRDPRSHSHDPRSRGHTNYEMPPPPPVYHKNDYSPHRPVAQVNGTTSYHNMPMRHNEHSYHSDHHLGSPPAPSSLLDLSNRENRGSAFELYKKPDGRSPHHGLPLHLNCDMPNPTMSSSSSLDSSHNVVAVARGHFDHRGGTLTSEETGVSIIIPPGAIDKGEEQEIYFKVCQDITMLPPLDAEKGETLLSPLVMCGPHGKKFNVPVELRLPHCAAVNPDKWSFALKSSNANGGQSAEWQNTSLDSRDGGPFSMIGDNFVSVQVDHF